MRKMILSLSLLLLLAGQGVEGATYYVRTTGSNTAPYDTAAKGATSAKTVIDYIRTNGTGAGDIVDIGAGTFSAATDYLYLDNANLDNIVVRGAGKGVTIIDPPAAANQRCVYLNDSMSQATVSDMTLIVEAGNKQAVYKTADAGVLNLVNVNAYSGVAHADEVLYFLGDETNLTCIGVYGNYTSGKYNIRTAGDSSGIFQYIISNAHGRSKVGNGWSLAGTGTTVISNVLILDAAQSGIAIQNGTVSVYNSIVQGGTLSHTHYALNRVSGTVSASNNLLISSPFRTGAYTTGTITKSGNIETNANPRFVSYGRGGFICPQVDDSGGYASNYVQGLEALLTARGMKGTWYTNISNLSADSYAGIRTMLSRGVIEVGLHGYTHDNLTATGDVFSITKVGHTINIDRTGNQIVVDGAAPVTVSGFKTKTLTAIRSELTAGGCTLGAIQNGLDASNFGEIMADSAGAQASPYTPQLLIDTTAATGYYYVQVKYGRQVLEGTVINGAGNVTDPQTGATYELHSYGATYNGGNANTKAAVTAALPVGNWTNYRYLTDPDSTENSRTWLVDVDLMAIGPASYSGIVTDASTNEATTRANARAMAFHAVQHGAIVPVFAHNATEMTLQQWGWALDEWAQYPGLIVTSMQDIANTIRAGGSWADDGDGTYSKTYTTYTDARLKYNSPCIDAGATVTGLHPTTDYRGRIAPWPAGGAVDIGPYEHRHPTVTLPGHGHRRLNQP